MTTTKMTTFTCEQFGEIRTLVVDGEPWFVGRDVAEALGYQRPSKAVLDHCKGSIKHALETTRGQHELSIIPESDLYRLILRSKLPSAEVFQDWVCEEVLPEIRKTGRYASAGLGGSREIPEGIWLTREQFETLLDIIRTSAQTSQGSVGVAKAYAPKPRPAQGDPSVIEWMVERCKITKASVVLQTTLYTDYQAWTVARGIRPVSHKMFGISLNVAGVAKYRTRFGYSRELAIAGIAKIANASVQEVAA